MAKYSKIFLISLLSFNALLVNAVVSDSETKTTEISSGKSLLEENYKKISTLKTNIDNVENVMAKFQTCEAKNKIYLGKNVSGADGDDCVDIQDVPVERTSRIPEWQGFTVAQTGVLASSYNPADTSTAWGRQRADYLCNSTYAGSRAMTASDLKYVYKDLINQIDGTSFKSPTNSKNIWLFDGWQSYVDDTTAMPKYSLDKEVADCSAWTSATGTGHVLELDTSTSNYNIKQNTLACSSQALIGCVSNDVISGTALDDALEDIKVAKLLNNLNEIGDAYDKYYLDTGKYLDISSQGGGVWMNIAELVASSALGWNGPYLNFTILGDTTLDYPDHRTSFIGALVIDDWASPTQSSFNAMKCNVDSGRLCYSWIGFNSDVDYRNEIDLIIDGVVDGATGKVRHFKADLSDGTYYILIQHSPLVKYN